MKKEIPEESNENFKYMWKLNNMLLNNQWSKKRSKEALENILRK